MRLAFVQTYPVYHDLWTTGQWLALENRDRWMPGIAAALGHEVELWAVDREASEHTSRIEGFGRYEIRLFAASGGGKTKFHTSADMLAHARRFRADLHVLKGIDGGAGIHLIRQFLRPERRPFVFVIGGKFYNRYVPHARAVLFESAVQRDGLSRTGWRFWRRPVDPARLIPLPKSIDTDRFAPAPKADREWDIITVGRLISNYKNYDALAAFSPHVRVAVAGTGPAEAELRAKYPHVHWLGHVANRDMPDLLNRAKLFFHTGRRDYFPRVLAEAAACGLPLVAFAGSVGEDVVPPEGGLLVTPGSYSDDILSLLRDPLRMAAMGRYNRERAERTSGKWSSREPLEQMLALCDA
jgi:glycosyltransferase involved in cell wall biosynthesis